MNGPSPVLMVGLLWLAFAVSHLFLSHPPVRARLAGALGARAFAGAYSLLALAIFVPLAGYYVMHRHAGPLPWTPPAGAAALVPLYAGNALAFVLIAAGLLTPAPSALWVRDTRVRGVHRITRHPVLMGAGLWGLMHLLVNGHAVDVVFFGGFPLLALVGCAHQDARLRAARGAAYVEFARATPFLPFTGGETLRGLREMPPAAWVLGIGVAAVLRIAHPWLYALAP